MSRSIIETILGAVVLAVAGLFLFFAYRTADLNAASGYEVTAKFNDISGLERGTDVTVGGVTVGSVIDIAINPQTYKAEVVMSINEEIELPDDTVAIIASASLLGGKTLSLNPGGSFDMIEPGGALEYTQSTPGIEQLLGQVIFSLQNLGSETGDP